jgi:hypothetical protein
MHQRELSPSPEVVKDPRVTSHPHLRVAALQRGFHSFLTTAVLQALRIRALIQVFDLERCPRDRRISAIGIGAVDIS